MIKNISFRRKSFGRMAKDYQIYRKPYNARVYKHLFSFLKHDSKPIRILDIGCGTGKSAEPLITEAPKRLKGAIEVTGCDHDPLMLKHARASAKKKGLPIKYVLGKAEGMPFKDRHFDAVIAGTAFHWFASKEAFLEISRVIRPGGMFMVFWKGPTYITYKGEPVGKNIYEKYKCTSAIKMWRNINNTKRLFKSGGFKGFKLFKIFENQKDTVDQLIGGHKTTSKYAILTPDNKKKFLNEMSVAYKIALGKKKYFTTKRETAACYAFR